MPVCASVCLWTKSCLIFRLSIFHFEDLDWYLDRWIDDTQRNPFACMCIFDYFCQSATARCECLMPRPTRTPPQSQPRSGRQRRRSTWTWNCNIKNNDWGGEGVREFDTHASYLQFCEGECESAWEQLRYYNGQMMFMLMICLSLSSSIYIRSVGFCPLNESGRTHILLTV